LSSPLKRLINGKIFLATSPKMDYLLVAQKDIANVKQFALNVYGFAQEPIAVAWPEPALMLEVLEEPRIVEVHDLDRRHHAKRGVTPQRVGE
jgi:hypothetical protein